MPSDTDRLGKKLSVVWTAFQHDVNVATHSLLYVLDSVHVLHLAERERLFRNADVPGTRFKDFESLLRAAGDIDFPRGYPRLRAFPRVFREPLCYRSAPDGPMEDFMFRGWIYEVWDLWESRYRSRLKRVDDDTGTFRPLQGVLGDLRHIRNNLIHGGVARKDQAARCTVLRWFRSGEHMRVRLRHILDFLNQMGWLQQGRVLTLESGRMSFWQIDRSRSDPSPTPSLISVRPMVDMQEQDPVFHYQASVVFEDGVFGQFAMGPSRREVRAEARDRSDRWMRMMVTKTGDLCVPGLTIIPASDLYQEALYGKTRRHPGMWMPPTKMGR